jgi:hypothetical protein
VALKNVYCVSDYKNDTHTLEHFRNKEKLEEEIRVTHNLTSEITYGYSLVVFLAVFFF